MIYLDNVSSAQNNLPFSSYYSQLTQLEGHFYALERTANAEEKKIITIMNNMTRSFFCLGDARHVIEEGRKLEAAAKSWEFPILEPWLFYIAALLEIEDRKKAKKIFCKYDHLYGLKGMEKLLPVANFADEMGAGWVDIEKSANIYKALTSCNAIDVLQYCLKGKKFSVFNSYWKIVLTEEKGLEECLIYCDDYAYSDTIGNFPGRKKVDIWCRSLLGSNSSLNLNEFDVVLFLNNIRRTLILHADLMDYICLLIDKGKTVTCFADECSSTYIPKKFYPCSSPLIFPLLSLLQKFEKKDELSQHFKQGHDISSSYMPWDLLPNFSHIRDKKKKLEEIFNSRKKNMHHVFSTKRWIDSPFSLSYYPDSFHKDIYPESRELFEKFIKGNATNNAGDFFRFYSFILNIHKIQERNVEGDFVELGVYKGNTAAILTYYANLYKKNVYLFDTFAGFDAKDLTGLDQAKKKQFHDVEMENVKNLVGRGENIIYLIGRFPSSIPEDFQTKKLSFVHIDCDLYEPTKAGLYILYPLITPGGMVLIHDYSSGYWQGCKKAVDEFISERKLEGVMLPDKSGSIIIQKHL